MVEKYSYKVSKVAMRWSLGKKEALVFIKKISLAFFTLIAPFTLLIFLNVNGLPSQISKLMKLVSSNILIES